MIDKKILILEGGQNEEHQVSISTSKNVKIALNNLNIKFDFIEVNPLDFEKKINKFSTDSICFNALHGSFGEDGRIQKILNHKGFICTHSNEETSSLAFNKYLSKKKIKNNFILTPEYFLLKKSEINFLKLKDILIKLESYIMKPICSGSSYGIHIFKKESDIDFFINNLKNNLKKYDNYEYVLIEKFIEGRELTVSVIDKKNKSIPIEVTEIIIKNNFFDYDSKYKIGRAKHVLPANIPKNIYNSCKQYAKKIHENFKCNGISRSDFIYDNKNLYFLEINTQPGLTQTSLLPEQLKFHGMSFDDLILNIIKSAK